MNYTGERPTTEDESSVTRSRNKYRTALKFINSCQCYPRIVRDIGCGIGLGYPIISPYGLYYGYDISQEAITEASKVYETNVFFTKIDNIGDLKMCLGGCFILSLEVIEHLELTEVKELIAIIKNTCQAEGYISTPNGDFFPYHPMNINERRGFHKWHYTYKELDELFKDIPHEIFGIEYDPNVGQFVTYGVYFKNI